MKTGGSSKVRKPGKAAASPSAAAKKKVATAAAPEPVKKRAVPLDFSQLGTAAVLSEAAVEKLRAKQPLLVQLLTEKGLTTPLLERALKSPLRSQRQIIRDLSAIPRRRHLLLLPDTGRAVESAEVTLLLEDKDLVPDWFTVEAPLGPWLAEQGARISKRNIEPLQFAPCAEFVNCFGNDTAKSFYGRRYQMSVALPWQRAVVLQIEEIWSPAIYALAAV